MSGYSWISGISIFCYLFLLLSFFTSKKSEGVIKSFEVLLAVMILWNGGSLGMRLQIWPGVNFWHHVSLLGMMMLPYGYHRFIVDFLDDKRSYMKWVTTGHQQRTWVKTSSLEMLHMTTLLRRQRI